ncbi:MAG: Trm112 family protein [Candidatus Eisenbacteria sp.]|nr:Trm112 family protein [Candidatus Eisenbacteria bacterium]
MISQELLGILVCPACKGDLQYEQEPERLICRACQLAYQVKDDIPIMLAEEAEHLKEPREGQAGPEGDAAGDS